MKSFRYRCFFGMAIVAALGTAGGCGGKAADDASTGTPNPDRVNVSDYAQPEFIFPDTVLTGRESLDAFIARFTRACIEGKYDQYRLYTSRKVEPVGREQFEKVYQAVERAEIKEIRPLPRISELPYPLWVVISEIRLRGDVEEPVRTVMVLVFQEEIKDKQQWVLAPAPRALREVISTTQPTSQPVYASQADSSPATAPAKPTPDRPTPAKFTRIKPED